MAAWAREAKIPMFFCGGSVGDFSVPLIGISSSLMLEEALDHLFKLGHKNIVLPLCERTPSFALNLKSVFSKKLISLHYDFINEFNTPMSTDSGVASFRACLDQSFAIKTPSAIVCLDWREYIASLCYLQEKGLKVPQDISLVTLSYDHSADWFKPIPTHFLHPLDKLASTLADWLEDISTYNKFTLNASVRGLWQKGETIAKAK